MRTLAPQLCAALLLLVAASGCGNALYFYETGKLSLTLEGRPDSSEPVQGNLAFKERTAVVSPPIEDAAGHQADTASMISSFRVKKEDTSPILGPLTMRTTLVTGAAAICLTPEQAQATAQAVAGVAIPSNADNAKLAIRNATAFGKFDRLKQLAAKPFSSLSDAEKTELGTITGIGDNYNDSLHEAVRKKLGVG